MNKSGSKNVRKSFTIEHHSYLFIRDWHEDQIQNRYAGANNPEDINPQQTDQSEMFTGLTFPKRLSASYSEKGDKAKALPVIISKIINF